MYLSLPLSCPPNLPLMHLSLSTALSLPIYLSLYISLLSSLSFNTHLSICNRLFRYVSFYLYLTIYLFNYLPTNQYIHLLLFLCLSLWITAFIFCTTPLSSGGQSHHSIIKPLARYETTYPLVPIKSLGLILFQVQCRECGHRSDTFEPFLNLSLEIQTAETLEQALQSFTSVETIDDPQVKLTCDGCRSRVSVNKQLTLDLAPSVISFHLKRFDVDGDFGNKNDKFVEFPKKLDLHPFLSDPGSTVRISPCFFRCLFLRRKYLYLICW